jgi:membrane-bound ClpP family serine protease
MTGFGIGLLVIGAIAVTVESHVPTLGMIGGPGVLALGVGAVLALLGLGGGLVVALIVALVVVMASAGLLAVTVRTGVGVRRRRVRAGPEHLLGHVGVVRRWSEPRGTVLIDGAIWRARRSLGDEDETVLHEGDPVVVEHLSGLTLDVRRADEWELTR